MKNTESSPHERYVSWWLKWEDLNWPNADNLDRIRRRADLIAGNSATTAVIFGAHFRWDWLPYFEILHDYLATVADELHQRGVKFFDHHSVNLVHRYDTRAEMRDVILHSQPHLPFSPCRAAAADWTYNGSRLNDWRMIDAVTRKPLYFPQYTGEGFCYRNPEFIAAYCEYAKKLIADTGIDGLLTDDSVQFQHYLGCACPCCRQALRERAGVDLPPADDANFWGNWENPAWKAWIDLRYEACAIFQQAVRQVLPPDFPTMSCGGNGGTATTANKACDAVYFLRGCNMQHLELCGNLPPYKHDPVTWNSPVLYHFVGSSYNSAAAEKVGARCVGAGYGFTEPSANIIWALNKCLGADCWFSTLKGRLGLSSADLAKLPDDFSPAGRAFRFEEGHPELFDTIPVRQAGVFFSRETRDHTLYGNLFDGLPRDFSNTQKLLSGAGIAIATVLEIPENTDTYRLLIVPGAASVTPAEAESLRRFAAAGGVVLIFGPCGLSETESPWKLGTKVSPDFWTVREGCAGTHPEKREWQWRMVDAPNAADEWKEVAPNIFYDPVRLPEGELEKSLLELTRKYMRPLPVEIFGTDGYFATVRRGKDGAYIVQLLAADYDTDIDHHLDEIRTHRTRVNLVVKAEPVNVSRRIRIDTGLGVEVFTPFNDEGAAVAKEPGGVTVTLPEKCPYAIMRLR